MFKVIVEYGVDVIKSVQVVVIAIGDFFNTDPRGTYNDGLLMGVPTVLILGYFIGKLLGFF